MNRMGRASGGRGWPYDQRAVSYVEHPIHLEATALPEHLETVRDAFARAGMEVSVAADYERRGAELYPWVVMIVLLTPIAVFLKSFASKLGERAADDAYDPLKQLLRDIVAARRGAGTGEGSIALSDPDGTNLVLPSSLPDESIEALRSIDWDAVRGDYLIWDSDQKVWHDPTKRR